jgi:hypothetical protein
MGILVGTHIAFLFCENPLCVVVEASHSHVGALLSRNLYLSQRERLREANWRNKRLSYHCHLNKIPLSI